MVSGETEVAVSGWTVDTLRAHVVSEMESLRTLLDERYDQQTKALDAAFAAADKAVQAAVSAADKAVTAALDSAERAVAKAETSTEKRLDSERKLLDNQIQEIRAQLGAVEELKANERLQVERVESLRREAQALREATDSAVHKNEMSVEKRFEGVNEFRKQLSDQANLFMPRAEAVARADRNADDISELKDRMNTVAGKSEGYSAIYAWAIAGVTLLIGVIVAANSLLR